MDGEGGEGERERTWGWRAKKGNEKSGERETKGEGDKRRRSKGEREGKGKVSSSDIGLGERRHLGPHRPSLTYLIRVIPTIRVTFSSKSLTPSSESHSRPADARARFPSHHGARRAGDPAAPLHVCPRPPPTAGPRPVLGGREQRAHATVENATVARPTRNGQRVTDSA